MQTHSIEHYLRLVEEDVIGREASVNDLFLMQLTYTLSKLQR